jgi:hypothetical protein
MPGQIVVPTPGSVLQGPIFSDFEPQRVLIAAVTNAARAVVTTSTPFDFQDGIYVRLIVPPIYGMVLSYVQTIIQIMDSTHFITNIDTSNLDPFVPPNIVLPLGFTPAQVVPMGDETRNIAA